MRTPTNSSRFPAKVFLSLVLAMTLGGPAVAGNGKEVSRGTKHAIVSSRPAGPGLPVSPRTGVVEQRPSESIDAPTAASAWDVALMTLATMLLEGMRF